MLAWSRLGPRFYPSGWEGKLRSGLEPGVESTRVWGRTCGRS